VGGRFSGAGADPGLGHIYEVVNPPTAFQASHVDRIQGIPEEVTGGLTKIMGHSEGPEQVTPGSARQDSQLGSGLPLASEDLIDRHIDCSIAPDNRQASPPLPSRGRNCLAHGDGGRRNVELEVDSEVSQNGSDLIDSNGPPAGLQVH
jgi:hypothetical protein